MKFLVFVLIVLIGVQCPLIAQADDSWYILDEKRRLSAGNYTVTTTPQSVLEIIGVVKPNVIIEPLANDDLFIIFDDHTHYNSRYQRQFGVLNFNYSNTPNVLKFKAINKNITHARVISVYDDDEPTSSFAGDGTNSGILNTKSSLSNHPLISSSNDIVANSDYTLVINLTNPRGKVLLSNSGLYRIKFEIDNPDWNGTENILTPSHIFNGSHITYTTGAIQNFRYVAPNEYEFRRLDDGNLFLNFQPVGEICSQFVNEYLVISIYNDNDVLIGLNKDPIKLAHDPNIIKPIGFCGDKRVKYYCSFYNENEYSADNLEVSLTFKPELNSSTFCVPNGKILHRRVHDRDACIIQKPNNTVVLDIQEDVQIMLLSSSPDDITHGLIEFEFYIDLAPGITRSDIESDVSLLKPLDAETRFDEVSEGAGRNYPLNYEHMECIRNVGNLMTANSENWDKYYKNIYNCEVYPEYNNCNCIKKTCNNSCWFTNWIRNIFSKEKKVRNEGF